MMVNSSFLENCRQAQAATIDRLRSREKRPLRMKPFDSLFLDPWREQELNCRNAPVVGQLCGFVPEEMILAAGAIPLRLDWGCWPSHSTNKNIVPNDVCGVVKNAAALGFAKEWPFSVVDLLIVPSACDGKKKLASILSDRFETVCLQLPQANRGERSIGWWLDELTSIKNRIQKLTGRKVNQKSLQAAVMLLNHRAELARQMNLLRTERCLPISGGDTFLVMQASFMADVHWWIRSTTELLEELQERVAQSVGSVPKARLLLTGSPIVFPDYQLLMAISDASADVVADEMCSATQRLNSFTVVDEWTKGGLLRAIAERTLLPCTCPCFVGNEGRVDRLLELAKTYRVDGIVHHTLRLCQLYDLDAHRVADQIGAQQIPWINIYSEHSSVESGGMKNRVDAFVEMIVGSIS